MSVCCPARCSAACSTARAALAGRVRGTGRVVVRGDAGGRRGSASSAVDWFNGGLFDDDAALPLTRERHRAGARGGGARLGRDRPAIFGTLFERGLDPGKRSQLGAHYTDRDKIMLIVEPVIIRPLARRMGQRRAPRSSGCCARPRSPAISARRGPAHPAPQRGRCALPRLPRPAARLPRARPGLRLGQFSLPRAAGAEGHRAPRRDRGRGTGAGARVPARRPGGGQGIEINPYAAELARVTVWIGEIQWMRRNGFDVGRNPILKPLDTIECRDAILNADGTEAEWPEADVSRRQPAVSRRKADADSARQRLCRAAVRGYLCRARAGRSGSGHLLVRKGVGASCRGRSQASRDWSATNSIRGGANRRVLDRNSQRRHLTTPGTTSLGSSTARRCACL